MLADEFGEFVAANRFSNLPSDVADAVKLRLLDVLGAGLAAYRLGKHLPLMPFLGGSGPATLWGEGRKWPLRDAVLLNSFLAHACYLEDGSRFSGGHPASVVAPGALAVAEVRQASGEDLIAAITTGYEVFLRLGRAIYPETVKRGFQSTAVLGAVASAASCASLLRLDAKAAANALAIACNLGAGLKAALKSPQSQPIQIGRACEGGLIAALFAEQGIDGVGSIMEDGFFQAFAGDVRSDDILDGLGARFSISETFIKIHGGCRGNHSPIDVVLELVSTHGINPRDIDRIDISVDSVTMAADIHAPRDGDEAQFSVPFAVAAALVKGDASVFRYTDENLADVGIQAMMGRISVRADTRLDPDYPDQRSAHADIVLRDGHSHAGFIGNARGEPETPLSHETVEEKYRSLTSEALGERSEKVRTTVQHLEEVTDAGTLTRLLSKVPGG